ncbi:hypothetical protein MMC2321_01650 [Chitinophaga sp. MM2321]
MSLLNCSYLLVKRYFVFMIKEDIFANMYKHNKIAVFDLEIVFTICREVEKR